MKLYQRDYTKLNTMEEAKWQSIQDEEAHEKSAKFIIGTSKYSKYSKALRHFESYFPNNYLDVAELEDKPKLKSHLEDFRKLINSDTVIERHILNFINNKRAYFLIASLFKVSFNFGHHDAYLFPEFQLGTSYKADYLLVGKNSHGYHFVFVELEAPIGSITTKEGSFGKTIRKGISQVDAWNAWIEAHYAAFSETFDKMRHADKYLPIEFTQLDISRFNYVVIAGRRTNFNDNTNRLRRKKQKDSSVWILHYDNLADAAENIIDNSTYC